MSTPTRKGGARIWRRTINVFNLKFGIEHSVITSQGRKYLERWILYCGGTLRLHKFYNGDEPVPHDHPWWFITFPLKSYKETVEAHDAWLSEGPRAGRMYTDYSRYTHWVKRFRFHFRPCNYRHFIHDMPERMPFYTIIITGTPRRSADGHAQWGFYPGDDKYVPWHERTNNSYG